MCSWKKCFTWGMVGCNILNWLEIILCCEVILLLFMYMFCNWLYTFNNWLETSFHKASFDVVSKQEPVFFSAPSHAVIPHFIMWLTFHCLPRETCLLLHPYLGIRDPTTKFLESRSRYSTAAMSYVYEFPHELTWSTLNGVKRQAPVSKQFFLRHNL